MQSDVQLYPGSRGAISDLIVQGGFPCIVLGLRSVSESMVALPFLAPNHQNNRDGLRFWISTFSLTMIFQRRVAGDVWGLPPLLEPLSQSTFSYKQVCMQWVKDHARRASL